MVLPGEPARSCPLPLLPSAGAPSPADLWGEARGHGGSPGGVDAPPPWTETCWKRRLSSVPDVGGPWSHHPAPAPQGSAPWGIAPFPGGAGTCHGRRLAPGAPARRGHKAVTVPGFGPGRSRAEADTPIYLCVWLGFVPPNPSSRPRVLWLGPEGSVGREDGPGLPRRRRRGAGRRCRGSPGQLDFPPEPRGFFSTGAAINPHSRSGSDDGHTAAGSGVSPCPSEGARRRPRALAPSIRLFRGLRMRPLLSPPGQPRLTRSALIFNAL